MNGMEAYRNGIKRVLITAEEIAAAVDKAGKQIAEIYDGSPILLVGILKGSFVFMSDMVRAIDAPCEIDFMCAKSYYSGTSSSGMVNITKDLEHEDLTGYHSLNQILIRKLLQLFLCVGFRKNRFLKLIRNVPVNTNHDRQLKTTRQRDIILLIHSTTTCMGNSTVFP